MRLFLKVNFLFDSYYENVINSFSCIVTGTVIEVILKNYASVFCRFSKFRGM